MINNKNKDLKDEHLWAVIRKDYHIDKKLGQGAYGRVMKCTSKASGKTYAVKLMTDVFDDIHYLKQLVREIHIMRKLSKMPSNIFTTELHDVIITRGLDDENT